MTPTVLCAINAVGVVVKNGDIAQSRTKKRLAAGGGHGVKSWAWSGAANRAGVWLAAGKYPNRLAIVTVQTTDIVVGNAENGLGKSGDNFVLINPQL